MKAAHAFRRAPCAPAAHTLALLAVLTLCSPNLRAGALTDGTAGRVQALSGKFTVPQSLGSLAGANLFHSFQSFSIAPGESATFTTTTALQNVIARVTGGTASTLNGPLKLDAAGGGKPSFFLINPAGVTFGAGSSVDVPGSFHLSTANYLKLADGSVYQTDLSKGSSFSAAAPQAFGFVGASTNAPTGAIVLKDNASLIFTGGQSVSVTGGDVAIGTNVLSVGGNLRITAVGQVATEVGLAGPMPSVAGKLVIDNGALVGSYNLRPTDSGEVTVAAGDIVIGSAANAVGGQIVSLATGAGVGGAIRVDAANGLTLQNGGQIASSTDQAGHGGDVTVKLGGKLQIGSGSGIQAITTGPGNAGSVTVAATGGVALDGGGSSTGAFITSYTSAAGASGNVSVSTAADLSAVNAGAIGSTTSGTGQAGFVKVEAGSITLDNQGAAGGTGIASNSIGLGNAGTVEVTAAGMLKVLGGGSIQTSTYGSGQAGPVTVHAGSILLDGRGIVTGILSETGGVGNAGSVSVSADADITLRDSARISSSSFLSGQAGSVTVGSSSLSILDANPGLNASGILSIARQAGNAGTVDVAVSGGLTITDGVISTSTLGSGKGGAVTVNAGSIAIGNTGANGGAGITSNASGTGDAGSVSVTAAQTLAIVNGGTISSSTFAQGAGGAVNVSAASIQMDGRASAYDTSIVSETYGSGNGGTVQVVARDTLSIVDQATVSSSAFSSGKGGQVRVQAGSISLDNLGGTRRAGIGSVAFSGSGDAGGVDVVATGVLAMSNGAEITANTSTAGAAGSVRVSANTVSVSSGASINSGATVGSSGRTGDVSVFAGHALTLTDARISIQNDATVAQPGAVAAGTLSVSASRIDLAHSEITASASGNIAAGSIVVQESALMSARGRSAINTSAVTGQGGSVVLRGGGALLLDHSRLTTSVTGMTNGDGGPTTIDSPVIVLNSGLIQANTAVASARGGDVNINTATPGILIASGQQLISGGQPVPYVTARDGTAGNGPNVIQAARPDGVNGDLHIASPQVDLSASLATLPTPRIDFSALGTDVCRVGDGSSLTPVGRGGLRPSYSERVRPSL